MKKRKINLSTIDMTTTYAGEFAGKYCGAALLSADTLDRGLVVIKPNIKYQETAKKIVIADAISDASCDFTDTGSVTLTERVLTPKQLQVNMELCKVPFENDWEAIAMGYSAHDNLPPKFSDYFIGQVAGMVAESTEKDIWMGDNSAGHFGGFVPAMTADGDVISITGAAGGITAANVIAEIGTVVDSVPDTIYGKPDFGIFIANNVARSYAQAMAALGYRTDYYSGEKPLDYNGIPLLRVSGLNPSYMVAAQKENLLFGTGLMSDFNEIKLIDMGMIDGSKNVRFVMRYTANTQYCIGSEIVLYTPAP